MAVDEHTRRVLYEWLEDVLGLEAATALMEHLPPVGWADVATKRDLDALAGKIDALAVAIPRDLDALGDRLRGEFDRELRGAVSSQTRQLLIGFVAINATTVGSAAVIAQLM